MTTGQVFVRETTKRVDGRRVVMMLAVVAVDDDFSLDGESKYTVVGEPDGCSFRVIPETGEPRPEFNKLAIDDIAILPHWHV